MDYIIKFIESYGLIAIFIVLVLEYSCFPIPSEVVLPLAGAIGFVNDVPIYLMVILSVVAGLIGSMFCYIIGYLGKNKIYDKLTNKKDKELKESKTMYEKYCNAAILIGRLIPLCRTYISFVAGANKHKITSYIIYTTIGITIWNFLLILLGYYFYDNLYKIGPLYSSYKNIIIICSLSILFVFILCKLTKLIKNKRENYFNLK